MTDLTSIIQRLIDAGTPADVAGEAIALAFGAGVASAPYRRSAGAERTARWRERHKASQSVTDRLTVTVDEQKKFPLKKPPKENSTPSEAKASSVPKRGSRLPEPFPLTEERRQRAERKIPADRVPHEFEKFCAHFWSASGANALKVDWDRAWDKWCLNAMSNYGARVIPFAAENSHANRQSPINAAIDQHLAALRSRDGT